MSERMTGRLKLRKLRPEDAFLIEKYASNYDVAKTTLNIPHPYPKGSGKEFVKHMLAAHEQGTNFTFAVEENEQQQLIGLVGISVTPEFNHGELGYWIGKPFWGKEYGTEAAKEIVRYGFEQLHLHRIYARAFAHNPASWKVMEKVGMTYEGTLREHVFRWGEYYDTVFYGMLKSEFKR